MANKKVLEVLNVGQGDSIIISPPHNCRFYDEKIFLVDLGPGSHDITQNISKFEKIHIFLTHHHSDHLNGLHFFFNKMHQIEEITVPLYQNEITLIAKAILNLKGINSSKDCGEFISALNEIVNNQIFLKRLTEYKDCPKLSFAYEGINLCNHISFLNPPKIMQTYDWLSEIEIENVRQLTQDIFENDFVYEMERYIRFDQYNARISDFGGLNEIFLRDEEIDYDQNVNHAKRNFVLNFILENSLLFRQFNSNATRKNLGEIYKKFVQNTHDVCIVLKAEYDGKSFLLSGDASKKVFKRLINEGKNISADYFKVPHHGSKNNLNKAILNKIDPEVAIISHKNGHFGKCTDTHPHIEVLQMLQHKGIKILITNDVIKNNIIYMKKSNHKDDSYVKIL